MTKEQEQELVKLCLTNLAAGASHAILEFAKVNHVNIKEGRVCKNPLSVFADMLMDEWGDGKKYPFEDSAKDKIEQAYRESIETLLQLFESGDKDNTAALCRVIGRGEMLVFLDDHRVEAVGMINKIRDIT